MNPLSVNLIRTYIPVLVGAVASWLAARGIHLQPQQTAWAVAAMTGVFSSAYYTIVRVLEEKFPALGPLLLLSRPAVSLHVAGACPAVAEAEDYGEGWPPRADEAGYNDTRGWEPAPAPQPQQPAPVQAWNAGYPPASVTSGVAPQMVVPAPPQPPSAPQTRPETLRVRKADTGAIPAYRRPPGR